MTNTIKIAEDFSDVPLGRHREDGPYTGEKFREDLLVPALEKATKDNPLVVILDDAEGYPSSFLEEAFGGLIRERGYSKKDLEALLKIEAGFGYSTYSDIIWEYIKQAQDHLKVS